MLDQSLERLLGQVEAVEIGVAALELGDEAQAVAVVVEAAVRCHAGVERVLAGVAERRVAEIVAERHRLGEFFVEPQRLGERASELGDLDRMGEARAEMVALVIDEHLGLVGKAAEGGRMDDAVAVALEVVAGRRRRLGVEAAAASGRDRRRKAPGRSLGPPPCSPPHCASPRCAYVHSDRPVDCLPQEGPMSDTAAAAETAPLSISAAAARRLTKVLAADPGAALRISVKGGGCSGFQYAFEIDATRADDDFVATRDGVSVVVDSASLEMMRGSELDFVDDLMGQAFKVKNPNAVALLRLRGELLDLTPALAPLPPPRHARGGRICAR